jgi:LAS superfamily LD-carboxypeptidase LdcB
MLSEQQLVGIDSSHVQFDDHGLGLHPLCWNSWEKLQLRAREQGFELAICSGFRSFERQLAIWNGKANGERPVLDDADQLIDIRQLSDEDKLHAILRFSALPGGSRHHWGSDVDVFDAAAVSSDYQVQLTSAEVSSGGVFSALHDWLDGEIAAGNSCGFYRPYECDRGGVAAERWHLSFQPLAVECEKALTPALLATVLEAADLRLKDKLLALLPEIYSRYILAL